ncbi:MAG: hypothetical protein PHI97_31505 [Desulfobulbus sp.]|nr:hypothetical protein [Desulfobulbus sp.]
MIEFFLLPLSVYSFSSCFIRDDSLSHSSSCPINRSIEPRLHELNFSDVNNVLQWERLKLKANVFLSLEDDWDGYGAVGIDSVVVNNFCRIIDLLQKNRWVKCVPDINPVASGTISLSWEFNNVEAYLEIGRTRYSGYVQSEEQDPVMVEGELESFDVASFCPFFDYLNSNLLISEPTARVKINVYPIDEFIPA